jgi:transposase InsO family protein
MPWEEKTMSALRKEFIRLMEGNNINFSAICRHFNISRKTGYKWMKRYKEGGDAALKDRSRRPHASPEKTAKDIEEIILNMRDAHKAWGGRKIKRCLNKLGYESVPGPSTITQILKRNACISKEESLKHHPFIRFEKERSNEMWQMDYKGYFGTLLEGWCHPLTILDDHSRYLLGLRACSNATRILVQRHLTDIFRIYGMPDSFLMDNGSPWGDDAYNPHTELTAWLIRLDILVYHGRPYHPQTQGKVERLHRTLNEELLQMQTFSGLSDCQEKFDEWRDIYNHLRPHEALSMQTPSSRYTPSSRPFPENLPSVIYNSNDLVRKVDAAGKIYFKGKIYHVGKAFHHNPVALRETYLDDILEVYFCKQVVAKLNIKEGSISK